MEQANILRKFIQEVHAMRTGDQRGEDNFGSDFMVRRTAGTDNNSHTHSNSALIVY